jgi:hypothetical protein
MARGSSHKAHVQNNFRGKCWKCRTTKAQATPPQAKKDACFSRKQKKTKIPPQS